MELAEFKVAVDAWCDEHTAALTPTYEGHGTLDEQLAHLSVVKRLAYDAGWIRWGWPERVGGLGGSSLHRGYLGEVLTQRGFVEPGSYSMTEVLVPTLIDFAPPELASVMVPKYLRGEETWCQGFSEPSTGSNLGSLACRSVRTDDGWLVNGQKVWTSFATHAQRCVLLTRSGTTESAHRGITALFVDMDTPGIVARPLDALHGVPELCEVFFDDVLVPFDRQLGDEGQGWALAMDLLPYERSTALWHRGALMHRRLEQFVEQVPEGAITPAQAGDAYLDLFAFRARSWATQHRLAGGGKLAAETSIDKVLLAIAEQSVFDLALDGLDDDVLLGDDPTSERWRSEFLYSRAASIYGGSGEIQRNIIARRLLDLGADR